MRIAILVNLDCQRGAGPGGCESARILKMWGNHGVNRLMRYLVKLLNIRMPASCAWWRFRRAGRGVAGKVLPAVPPGGRPQFEGVATFIA